MAQGASMFVAAGAQAQTAACDQLKATLAARIEASGVRGYSLEAVPAADPVPAGAKAIGTCESGTYKVLYRRWGVAQAAADAASAAAPAQAPPAVVAPDAPPRRAPVTRTERASRPLSASAPGAALQPALRSSAAAVAVAAAGGASDPFPAGSARGAEAPRAADHAVVQPVPGTTDTTPETRLSLPRQVSGFMAANWRWIGALALLAVAGGTWWLWRTRYSPYDEAGLPRGPRL
jgi:hypothetical protein